MWFLPDQSTAGRGSGRSRPSAQLAGRTLALQSKQTRAWSLHDLDNDAATLVEYPPTKGGVAKLSPDGLWFARQTASDVIRVTDPGRQGGRSWSPSRDAATPTWRSGSGLSAWG